MTYQPYRIFDDNRPARWLVTCDHASNRVPDFINGGDLGLPADEMARHIAYDVGAAGVALALAEQLNAPAILSNFSRLVIDPNRGEDDPTLLMKLYDGTIIPGNRDADNAEREKRLEACYRPYHRAQARLAARRTDTIVLSIHSFTPRLNGRSPRPWHIGILHAQDIRLAQPLIARLRQEPDLQVGENEPYGGHLPGDSIDRHATAHGRPNLLIELRNDLIRTNQNQSDWAARLALILHEVLEGTDV